jgi:hypothetical protein
MKRLYIKSDPEDFRAMIRFFPLEEGGRRQYPNGVRFDFQYQDDKDNLYMIHPDFFDDNGDSYPEDRFFPLGEWLNARMYIVVAEMREKVHRHKLKIGQKFFCCDGSIHIAEGVVTEIVGLNN